MAEMFILHSLGVSMRMAADAVATVTDRTEVYVSGGRKLNLDAFRVDAVAIRDKYRRLRRRMFPEKSVQSIRAWEFEGAIRQAVCMGGSKESLPPLLEPQLTGISPLAMGLEGCEEAQTPSGVVFYRQGWWCRMS